MQKKKKKAAIFTTEIVFSLPFVSFLFVLFLIVMLCRLFQGFRFSGKEFNPHSRLFTQFNCLRTLSSQSSNVKSSIPLALEVTSGAKAITVCSLSIPPFYF